jgi:hypothetical protein
MSEIENKNSNFNKVINSFKLKLPIEYHDIIDETFYNIKNYIENGGFEIKVLNSCPVPFKGVRTRDYIIICSPQSFNNLAEFVYILFHEIRHEIQIGKLKQTNPLSGDIEDFEELYDMYWDMEMDAHNFGMEWVEKIDKILNLPSEHYNLSNNIRNYPSMSNITRQQIQNINKLIKEFKAKGYEYSDISDLPLVKNIIDKLENFF